MISVCRIHSSSVLKPPAPQEQLNGSVSLDFILSWITFMRLLNVK